MKKQLSSVQVYLGVIVALFVAFTVLQYALTKRDLHPSYPKPDSPFQHLVLGSFSLQFAADPPPIAYDLQGNAITIDRKTRQFYGDKPIDVSRNEAVETAQNCVAALQSGSVPIDPALNHPFAPDKDSWRDEGSWYQPFVRAENTDFARIFWSGETYNKSKDNAMLMIQVKTKERGERVEVNIEMTLQRWVYMEPNSTSHVPVTILSYTNSLTVPKQAVITAIKARTAQMMDAISASYAEQAHDANNHMRQINASKSADNPFVRRGNNRVIYRGKYYN